MGEEAGKSKNTFIIVATIIIVIICLLAYTMIGQGVKAVTINEFYDDQIDRNSDGIIDEADYPYEWNSYDLGDKVLIRDKIDGFIWDPDANLTTLLLINYTGDKYVADWNRPNVPVEGYAMDLYSKGDIITVEFTMIEYPGGHIAPEMGGWRLVE